VNPLWIFLGFAALVVIGALLDAATGGRMSAWLKRHSGGSGD
jgi:hypothetical protein